MSNHFKVDLSTARSEADVENKIIIPLLKEAGIIKENKDYSLRVPVKMTLGRQSVTKEADIVVYKNKKPFIVIEAKSKGERLDDDEIAQLDSYAVWLPAPYGIICNGLDFVLRGYLSGNEKVYLIKKTLPWINIEKLNIDKIEKYRKVRDLKISTLPEELCSGLPKEFCDYIKYCRNLTFEQEPNYNYLKNLFLEVIKKNEKITNLNYIGSFQFSWSKKENIRIGNLDSLNNRSIRTNISGLKTKDLSKGKENTHKRLYSQIKLSSGKPSNKSVPKIQEKKNFKLGLKKINLIVNNNISIGGNINNTNDSVENNYIFSENKENNKKNNIYLNPQLKITKKEGNYKSKIFKIISNVRPLSRLNSIDKTEKNSKKISGIRNSIDLNNINYLNNTLDDSLKLNRKRYYKTLKEREQEKKKSETNKKIF